MESTYAFNRAIDLAGEKGKLMGTIGFVLKYSKEVPDDVFRSLAQIYIEVAGDDEWNRDDVIQIRAEASRRGINVG